MEVNTFKSESHPQKAAQGTEVTGLVFSISENTEWNVNTLVVSNQGNILWETNKYMLQS